MFLRAQRAAVGLSLVALFVVGDAARGRAVALPSAAGARLECPTTLRALVALGGQRINVAGGHLRVAPHRLLTCLLPRNFVTVQRTSASVTPEAGAAFLIANPAGGPAPPVSIPRWLTGTTSPRQQTLFFLCARDFRGADEREPQKERLFVLGYMFWEPPAYFYERAKPTKLLTEAPWYVVRGPLGD